MAMRQRSLDRQPVGSRPDHHAALEQCPKTLDKSRGSLLRLAKARFRERPPPSR